MIFNHNIVQRSKRLLFDNGYQNPVTGGWRVVVLKDGNGNPVTNVGTIGETIEVHCRGTANNKIVMQNKIDLTNITTLHCKVSVDGTYTKDDTCVFLCGVGSSFEDDAELHDFVKAAGVGGSVGSATESDRIYGYTTDTVCTLDVSDLSGEYYIAVATRKSKSGNLRIDAAVERIWWS